MSKPHFVLCNICHLFINAQRQELSLFIEIIGFSEYQMVVTRGKALKDEENKSDDLHVRYYEDIVLWDVNFVGLHQNMNFKDWLSLSLANCYKSPFTKRVLKLIHIFFSTLARLPLVGRDLSATSVWGYVLLSGPHCLPIQDNVNGNHVVVSVVFSVFVYVRQISNETK